MTGVEENDGWQVKAGRAAIHAKNVVLATNLPIAGPVPYDERTRPRSHIAMAFRVDPRAAIDGMFIGIDEPTHSLRMGRDQDGLLLVVLGSKFGTGQEGDVAKHFHDLEAWTRQNLEVGDVAWRWVNEDYDTADRVPFAGALSQAPGSLHRHGVQRVGYKQWHSGRNTDCSDRFSAGPLIGRQSTIPYAKSRKNLTRAATANHWCIASTISSQAAAR